MGPGGQRKRGCPIAKGKDLEMFEAFRNARDLRVPKPPTEDAAQPTPAPPAGEEPAVETSAVETPAAAKPAWHRGVVESKDVHVFPLGQRTDVVFRLSYNALTGVIIVLVLFGVLMGCLGYAIGVRSAPSSKPVAVAGDGSGVGVIVEKDEMTKEETSKGGVPTKKIRYRIRVLTVPNTPERRAAIDEDIAFLNQNGVKDIVKQESRRGSSILLYAGAFTADQRQAAEALAQQLQKMPFRGRDEFKDARVVTVEE